jgi:hypothetical protein
VRNVFTIGTPHQGSLLANLVWSPEGRVLRLFMGLDIGSLSMLTIIMQLYRLLTDELVMDDYVQYYSGAGNFWDTPNTFFAMSGPFLQSQATGGDNDGVVTVASTSLPYAKPLFLEPWNHVQLTLGRNSFPYLHDVLRSDVVAPTDMQLIGPTVGTIGREVEFSIVMPITVTLPVSYTWSATQQFGGIAPDTGRLSSVKFTWPDTGVKTVTVTAKNSVATVSKTLQIQINPLIAPTNLTLSGPDQPDQGEVNTAYQFDAALPLDTTTPVTYTWSATDQFTVAKPGNTNDRLTLTWKTPGRKTVTVSATNEGGTTQTAFDINIAGPADTLTPRLYLPNMLMQDVSRAAVAAPLKRQGSNLADGKQVSNYILRGGSVDTTASVQLPVEAGARSAGFLLLTSDPGVQAQLVAPDGTPYPMLSSPADPGTPIFTASTFQQTVNPVAPGAWTLELQSANPAGYLLMMTLDSPLKVALSGLPDLVAQTGSTVSLDVSAQSPTATATLDQVVVNVADPEVATSAGPDDLSAKTAAISQADGALDYVLPTKSGFYKLSASVTGQVNGSAFERSFADMYLVISKSDVISSSFLKGLLEQWYCDHGYCSAAP